MSNEKGGDALLVQMNSSSNLSETRSWLQTIIDSSHLITFCVSISVIIYGSFRSLNIDKENDSYIKQQDSINSKRDNKKLFKKKVKKRVTTNNENELLLTSNEHEIDKDEGGEEFSQSEMEEEIDEQLCESDNSQTELHEHQSTQNIDSTQALFIPVAASISLLLMFFFF